MTFNEIKEYHDNLVRYSNEKILLVQNLIDVAEMREAFNESFLFADKARQIRETLFANAYETDQISVYSDEINDSRILATIALIKSWQNK